MAATETVHLIKVDSMTAPTEYKGYSIAGDGTFGYKNIKPVGKGSVPADLRGLYTNANFAKKGIDSYLAAKEAAEVSKKVEKKAS